MRLILAVILIWCCAAVSAHTSESGGKIDDAIQSFSDVYFDYLPEMATYLVVKRKDSNLHGRLNARSEKGRQAREMAMEQALKDLRKSAATGADQAMMMDTLVTLLDVTLAPGRIVDYGTTFGYTDGRYLPYVLNHLSGPLADVPWLLETQHQINSTADADAYLSRLKAFANNLDETVDKVAADAGLGVLPPTAIVDRTLETALIFAELPVDENPLLTSFDRKLQRAGIPDSTLFVMQARHTLEQDVVPAYRRTISFLERLRSKTTNRVGIWRLPEGRRLYRALIRQMTEFERDPDDIHVFGLKEVSRITDELDKALHQSGFVEGSVGLRLQQVAERSLKNSTSLEITAQDVLDSVEHRVAQTTRALDSWFSEPPAHSLEVRPIPDHAESQALLAYYDGPTADGKRPGVFWINLSDPSAIPRSTLPSLTYHETIPGHHLQVSASLTRPQPSVSKAFWSNAATEGWALYAEALAAEMGLYKEDPLGDIGRLRLELRRAIRLVVDTGIHHRRWTRGQAIRYVMNTEGSSIAAASEEVDRFIVWPAQALAYTLGMSAIMDFRTRARGVLGCRFDIRVFHERLLNVSPPSLLQFEVAIDRWLASTTGDPC